MAYYTDSNADVNPSPADNIIPLGAQAEYSREAEQSVIGGLMFNKDAWAEVSSILEKDDFFLIKHQLLFIAISQVIKSGDNADPITVGERLQKDSKFTQIGGSQYLGLLAGNTQLTNNIAAYARIVKERSINRKTIAIAKMIANTGDLSMVDNLVVLRDAKALLNDPNSQNKAMSLNDFMDQALDAREVILDPILTTHSENIIYAEAGVGKTHFITELAYGISYCTCSSRESSKDDFWNICFVASAG